MEITRRNLLGSLAVSPLLGSVSGNAGAASGDISSERVDPWIEIEAAALRHNLETVKTLVAGRPILAVIKNNAYGLGLIQVAKVLDFLAPVSGFAVIKAEEAMLMREAGITKPILLLGQFSRADGPELARRDIQFSYCAEDSGARIATAAKAVGETANAQLYLDTGMGRIGIPYYQALLALEEAKRLGVNIRGTFMCFTESEFDAEQLDRFKAFVNQAKQAGHAPGTLHAASSNAIFNFPQGFLDQVRPGLALFGAYPSPAERADLSAPLRPALRLCARVVRVHRLRPGDSVSYGQNYTATVPTWTATIPVGHADGYPRAAVKGARVLIGQSTYPVIGAVSASHTIVELGAEKSAEIGDLATLIGPDHPDTHPNAIAASTGISAYDTLMHLSAALPRVLRT